MKIKFKLILLISLFAGLHMTSCEPEDNDPDPEPKNLEPNNSLETSSELVVGDSLELEIQYQDEDWFHLTVPSGHFSIVKAEFDNSKGDLDMVVYNSDKNVLSNRYYRSEYPYFDRGHETGTECYSFFPNDGSKDYYFRILGFANDTNNYTLTVKESIFADCCICEDEGFSSDFCRGYGKNGQGLLPFPVPFASEPAPENNYFLQTYLNYRYARPEVIMAVRYAISETLITFPGSKPLGLGDMSQSDGLTPAQDVGYLRHPLLTHSEGGNIDIAYFQTGGDNLMRSICGSAGDDGKFCNDGAIDTHKVDLEKTAFFMAKLYDSPRIRVIGSDRVIGPLILEAAQDLASLPENDPRHITDAELSKFDTYFAWGDGWPYHHHHIHVSFNWWN